jgi:hypothetical protein
MGAVIPHDRLKQGKSSVDGGGAGRRVFHYLII